jgi:hypothetical protein
MLHFSRPRALSRAILVLAPLWLIACVDRAPLGPSGDASSPSFAMASPQGVDRAIAAQERYTAALIAFSVVSGRRPA